MTIYFISSEQTKSLQYNLMASPVDILKKYSDLKVLMTLKSFYSIIELKVHRKFRVCLHRILKVNSRTTGIKKKKLVARLVKKCGEMLVELLNIAALATEVFVPV